MSAGGPGPRYGLSAAILGAMARRARGEVADRVHGTRLYRWLLRGPMPDRLLRVPDDLWPGQPALAEAMMRGEWRFEGVAIEAAPHPFDTRPPTRAWFEALHGFAWLRHFQALGGEGAERGVRALVREWVARHMEPGPGGPLGQVWAPGVTGRRLVSFACHARLVLDSSDLVFRSQVLRAMVRQAAHLARVADQPTGSAERLAAGLGLAFAGLVLPQAPQHLAQGLERVCAEADRQLLSDGGHVGRSPAILLEVLADLVMLKAALIQARADVPAAIQMAIDRATPMVRFFRHGDGGLALFNGVSQTADSFVDRVLTQADAKGRPLGLAPHSGYGRMAAKRSLVIMDMGAPPPFAEAERAHAGSLSFEFSTGRHRLVTNCGDGRLLSATWEQAGRSTAAHSTLVIDDKSQLSYLAGSARDWLGARPKPWRGKVSASREEDAHGLLLDGRHTLYADRFGVVHHRRLFLDIEGTDLRGEDALERAPASGWLGGVKPPARLPWTLRFHLHPDVRASLARDGRSVLLILANGDGWVFRASTGALSLEESVYLADSAGVRRTNQIVIAGEAENGAARLKWAFKRS